METKKEFITSEGQHWYESKTKPGVYYPSATTILSVYPKGKGFERYLANQTSYEDAQEKLEKAGKRGTNVHEASEMLESGMELVREYYTLEEWEMLMGFVAWHDKFEPRPIAVELGVISDKKKVGGTIDRVYDIGGSVTLVDLKTSSAIHENYWLQTAIYAELYEEIYKTEVDFVGILRLTDKRKDRYEYKAISRDEWKKNVKIFKAVYAIWESINPTAGPKLLEVPTTLKLCSTTKPI